MPASSMPYYLVGSNKANWQGNFYVSILKDESLDESNEPQTIAAQDYSLPIHKSFDINQIRKKHICNKPAISLNKFIK